MRGGDSGLGGEVCGGEVNDDSESFANQSIFPVFRVFVIQN